MTTVQTYRIKFESLSIFEYKIWNIWIDPKVIFRLTKCYYEKSNFSYNSNSILEGLLRNCSHEKTSKTMDARGEEPWRNILTSFRDTATRSNGIKVIRTKVRPISAGVSSMGDILGLFAGVAPSERRLTGNDTKIGSIWDLSILMRYRCMRILL